MKHINRDLQKEYWDRNAVRLYEYRPWTRINLRRNLNPETNSVGQKRPNMKN